MNDTAIVEVPILIAGGGSTGLSLAAELGWRGTPCMLVEPGLQPNPHPRANALGNRSMEYYRRWGIDRQLTGAGVPAAMRRWSRAVAAGAREAARGLAPAATGLEDFAARLARADPATR